MPDAEPERSESPKNERDAYDKANTWILAFTLIAASAATVFTGCQAYIARDQERRTLRAYVVSRPQLVLSAGDGFAHIVLTSENMGQTPAYNLFFIGDAQVVDTGGRGMPYPFQYAMSVSCRDLSNYERAKGVTFSKTTDNRTAIADDVGSITHLNAMLNEDQALYAYGTVCYRDIFRVMHTERVCFMWSSTNRDPEKCPDQNLTED